MKKIIVLIAILSIIAFVCGCLSISMYTKVNREGNISDLKIEINTTSTVYGLMQSSVQQQGYSTVKEYMLSNVSKEYGTSSGNTFDYNEEWSGENVKMTLTAKGSFKPDTDSSIKIYKDGSFMIFEYVATASPTPTPTPTASPYGSYFNDSSLSGLSDTMLNSITFNFYLEMPGKIVDSNANVVKDNKAEWHLTGKTMSGMKMYAKSEIPTSVPGFEGILAIASIFAGYCIIASIKKEN
ncbi:hypothetical protein [Methanocella conradii]|uniref:hypothetical protein n=1 Tax=Methanocella conradii TaxID=1175444 RepID=UPI0024B38F3C|nr:hypothetical protein [Methanocella conradii]MDI6898116.1 hypothetical protein [Methanocella conradii]